jgi:hypothetical protein
MTSLVSVVGMVRVVKCWWGPGKSRTARGNAAELMGGRVTGSGCLRFRNLVSCGRPVGRVYFSSSYEKGLNSDPSSVQGNRAYWPRDTSCSEGGNHDSEDVDSRSYGREAFG